LNHYGSTNVIFMNNFLILSLFSFPPFFPDRQTVIFNMFHDLAHRLNSRVSTTPSSVLLAIIKSYTKILWVDQTVIKCSMSVWQVIGDEEPMALQSQSTNIY